MAQVWLSLVLFGRSRVVSKNLPIRGHSKPPEEKHRTGLQSCSAPIALLVSSSWKALVVGKGAEAGGFVNLLSRLLGPFSDDGRCQMVQSKMCGGAGSDWCGVVIVR